MRLRTVSPEEPGWRRRRAGRGFAYVDHEGSPLGAADAQRCRELVIPPAWESVWICPHPNGHLQAVGTDSKGRRQYLYHEEWRRQRDAEKFDHMLDFAARLPAARRRSRRALGLDGVPEPRADATAFRLLDRGYFRIGSDTYTNENGSYGLTTLRREHVRRRNDRLLFDFPGKGDAARSIEIADAVTIAAVDAMRRRRGGPEELLAYRDGRRWRHLDAAHVNDYLKDLLGEEVSAKDFRTWHGTVRAAVAFGELALAEQARVGSGGRGSGLAGRAGGRSGGRVADRLPTNAAQRRAVAAAMREVAEHLGNTPAVARGSYVAPAVIDKYLAGETIAATLEAQTRRRSEDRRIHEIEEAVLRLLA